MPDPLAAMNAPEDVNDESEIHQRRLANMIQANDIESDLAWAGAYKEDGTLMTPSEAKAAGVLSDDEVEEPQVELKVVEGGKSPDEPNATPPVVLEGGEYVCSSLAIMVKVDRWHGRRKTGEWTSDLMPVLASIDGERPFDLAVDGAINTIIDRIKKQEEEMAKLAKRQRGEVTSNVE